MLELKKRILEIIGKPHLAAFATTTEAGLPWVRYVFPVASDDMTIRFSTFLTSRKVNHIRNNPEVHITCGVTDPENYDSYLQIQGTAVVSTDPDEKSDFWMDEFARYFRGPDDPNYSIVKVTPYRIELYSAAGGVEPDVWEA